MAKRRNFSPVFQGQGGAGDDPLHGKIAELAVRYQVHPSMIGNWKRTALEGLKTTFARGAAVSTDREEEITRLQAKIGELVSLPK